MKKCEWENNRFYPCEGLTKNRHYVTDSGCLVNDLNFTTSYTHCPFCGADIRKPKPTVTIKKSGGTWVARYDGVDIMCTEQNAYSAHEMQIGIRDGDTTKLIKMVAKGEIKSKKWKPISEIEITDEVALLRPMVVAGDYVETLVYVNKDYCMTDAEPYQLKHVHLATVADLEEV